MGIQHGHPVSSLARTARPAANHTTEYTLDSNTQRIMDAKTNTFCAVRAFPSTRLSFLTLTGFRAGTLWETAHGSMLVATKPSRTGATQRIASTEAALTMILTAAIRELCLVPSKTGRNPTLSLLLTAFG